MCLDSVIFSLWRFANPSLDLDEYKSYLTEIFGENLNLKTVTVTNILRTIGFKLGYYFKIVSVLLNNKTNHSIYHFERCNCSGFKYNTRLLFTNKSNIKDNAFTFIYFNKCVYFSKDELYGRTISSALTNSVISSSLPNKNLYFLYSINENLFYAMNRVNNDECFGVEIISDNYLITPISNLKKNQTLHLAHDSIPPYLNVKNEKKSEAPPQLCTCNINEKDLMKIKPLGKNELMTNIQMHLETLGIYPLYKDILTFLSRMKMISYDIETQTSEFSESLHKLKKGKGDIYHAQNILENGAILNKLNILLIGSCSYMSVSSIKQIIRKLTKLHINEDILQSNIVKKLQKAHYSSTFHTDVKSIIEEKYEPEILLFEDVKHFFAHLIRFTRLSEYLSYIVLSGLIYQIKVVKEKGMFSLLFNHLNSWILTHYIFAFNGANFDNILIENALSAYLLALYKSKIRIKVLCNGLRCVNLAYSVSHKIFTNSNNVICVSKNKDKCRYKRSEIIFRDTRKIIARGSLNDLAKVYELNINKLTFPYGFLKSKQFLLNVTNQNILMYDMFYDILKFQTMSDTDQQLFLRDFKNSKCQNLYAYLKLYLNRDVLVLHNLMNKILDAFNDLDCNIILQKKLTISSIAFSNIYIYQNMNNLDFQTLKITSSNFINQTLKNSIIGGYTCTNIANNVNSDFVINESLSYSEKISDNVWHKIPSKPFDQRCNKILSYDIRYAKQTTFYLICVRVIHRSI
mgnify:FL=1